MAPTLPLKGLSVVELVGAESPAALSLAAAMCGRIASDLGAGVTRVISKSSDQIDHASDVFLNSGKTCLSVAQDRFDDLAQSLIVKADGVVMDAATLGEAARQGDGPVIAAIGMTADAAAEGTEFTIEAQSGLLDLIGDPERQPLRLGGHQVAFAAGLAAYLAIVSALPRKAAGLSTPVLQLNLLDIAVWLNWKTIAVAARTGETPTRKGPKAEWSALECGDGYFAAVYRSKDWAALKSVLNDPRLEDPKIQTVEGRREHRSELNALLSTLFQRLSRAEIHALSLANKLPLGPVWSPEELGKSAHLIDRKFLATVETRDGPANVPTLPVKWTGRTFSPADARRS